MTNFNDIPNNAADESLAQQEQQLMNKVLSGDTADKFIIEHTGFIPESELKQAEFEKQVILTPAMYEKNKAIMEGKTPEEIELAFQRGMAQGLQDLASLQSYKYPTVSYQTSTRSGRWVNGGGIRDISGMSGDREL